jgi:hypothetical protein
MPHDADRYINNSVCSGVHILKASGLSGCAECSWIATSDKEINFCGDFIYFSHS